MTKGKQEKKEAKGDSDEKRLLEEKDAKIAELTDIAQRMQAEFENYKKRCDKSSNDYKEYATAEILEKLLPILDSFELALKNTENKQEFIKGVELIFGQFFDILEKEGLRPIKTVGEKFDPYKHECLLTCKTEKDEEDELVTEELQKGYMLKAKVIRYAKVKVKKKS